MHVINTIKDEEIEKENISETIHFDDDDDSELIDVADENGDDDFDDDFEVEIAKEDTLVDVPESEKQPNTDAEASLAEQLVAEFGVYDPTKDLDGYLLPPIDLLK